jgi:hypothetical protein
VKFALIFLCHRHHYVILVWIGNCVCVCVYSALVNDGPVTIVIDSDVPSSKEAATDLEEKLPLAE